MVQTFACILSTIPHNYHLNRPHYNSTSTGAQNQVHAALCADDVADLADLERVRRVLERLLHLSGAEPAEVASG